MITRILGFTFLLQVFFFNFAPAELLDAKKVNAKMDAYLAPYVEAKDFSGVVLVGQKDRIIFEKAYGFADWDKKKPNRINTAFRTASVSKTFTGAAIAILLEKNLIQLEDPLSRFIPDFPNGSNILIKHLLLHSSGVGQLDAPEYSRQCFSTSELVQLIAKLPPLFKPGEDGQYSNEGYILLAAIIEKVSKMSYESFLQKHIWEPLGMKNTDVMCNQWPVTNHSNGSIAAGLPAPIPIPFEQAVPNGPGSVYSTATDLFLWLKALSENRPFNLSKLSYPYGWGKRDYSGRKLVEQSGLLEGYNAHIAMYPDQKIYFVFLSNIQSGLFNRLPKDFEAVVFEGTPSSPPVSKEIQADSASLKEFEGAYLNQSIPVPMNIELEDARLWLRWGKSEFRRPLILIANDELYFRAEYARFKFERDDQKRITQILCYWGDGDPLIMKKQ